MKIGLVYGSTTGNTEDAAEKIRDHFDDHVDECLNISGLDLERLKAFDVLLIGIPTWNIGELQQDWDEVFNKLDPVRFDGIRVAFFGQGDQRGYPDNFQDALGILRNKLVQLGAQADLGHWSTEGYFFQRSLGVIDETKQHFVGLALDEDGQPELTDERIEGWCAQVKSELGLE
ncbi:flavodoxin [Engelhardtia mirabilis]|uniref:Flavodoxin n=1 Tax=Engelhardtia mirabilis TaxID=2528011 RepID=A0A518BIE4_9BACT|nr:Flavodoxin [Planctomycetes bacterium Pla133]QDV01076.1 Flavodoxin [Planctomycetes bacterium Pla86]